MAAPVRPRVSRSCGEDWAAMPRASTGRACARCDRVVLDLRGRTEREARALLRAQAAALGSACGRIEVDATTREAIFAPERHAPSPRTMLRGLALVATLATGCESVSHAETRRTPAAVLAPLGAPSSPRPVPDGPPMIANGPDGGTASDAGTTPDAATASTRPPRYRHHSRSRPPQVQEEMGMMMPPD